LGRGGVRYGVRYVTHPRTLQFTSLHCPQVRSLLKGLGELDDEEEGGGGGSKKKDKREGMEAARRALKVRPCVGSWFGCVVGSGGWSWGCGWGAVCDWHSVAWVDDDD
jgi:hypothetical protein